MGITGRLTSLLLRMPPWLLSAVALALLLLLTLIPASDVPRGPDLPGLDKIIHFLMFGLTATALAIDMARQLKRISVGRLIAIALCVSLLGAMIEWFQEIMQMGRSAETADLVADIAGSFLLPPCFLNLIRRIARNADFDIISSTSPSTYFLRKVRNLYFESFPDDERRPWTDFKTRISDPQQQPELLIIKHHGHFAGFLTMWRLDNSTRYIEHFAILPQLRGQGIGSLTLSRLINVDRSAIVLEAEPVETSPQAASRIAFYERNGFTAHPDFNYIQPPYSPDLSPVRLTLMTANIKATESDLTRIAGLLHTEVYLSKQ